MNAQPNPVKTKVERKSDNVAVVSLTFTKTAAAACRRCDLCTAKPGPTKHRAECTNEMPSSSVTSFIWGSPRVGRLAATAPTAPTADPAKKRGRVRRRQRPEVIANFSSARSIHITMGYGRPATFYVWTEDEWAREANKPAYAWPMHGGGMLWVTLHPNPLGGPIKLRPRKGAPARCSFPRWLDVWMDFGVLTSEGQQERFCVYRVSLWREDELVRRRFPSLCSLHQLDGESGKLWLALDPSPFIEMRMPAGELKDDLLKLVPASKLKDDWWK